MLLLFRGQGVPNMDFVVRETRAVVQGPMSIIRCGDCYATIIFAQKPYLTHGRAAQARFGTCGSVQEEVTPGSVVVSGKGSVMVTRNPDAFFPDAAGEDCYRVSRVMPASPALSKAVALCLLYGGASAHVDFSFRDYSLSLRWKANLARSVLSLRLVLLVTATELACLMD